MKKIVIAKFMKENKSMSRLLTIVSSYKPSMTKKVQKRRTIHNYDKTFQLVQVCSQTDRRFIILSF